MMLFLLLAVLAGALLPVQTGINVQLRGQLGQPLAAALVSFLIGSVGLAAVAALMRVPFPLGTAWSRGLWWHWSGGLLGAAYIVGTVVLAPRLGAATLIAALVAGQMIASLLVDHYGWVGFAEHPISPIRLAGAVLIVAGVVLVRR